MLISSGRAKEGYMFPNRKHNLAEEKVRILKALLERPLGVRQLARALRLSPSRVIALQAEMEDHGLLQTGPGVRRVRGRPMRVPRPTSLGREYLAAHSRMELIELRANLADLHRAASDARYARRLSAAGVSTSDLFLELNEIALRHS
jgi:DNA-binding MarR family transcriptional regulator